MRYFMEHSVLPYLRTKLGIREVIVSRVLKLFGIGESLVDERLKDLIEEGTNPTIGLLAHTHIGEIHVRLTAKSAEQAQAEALNAALETKVRERLGEFIFGVDEESYEGVLNALLVKAGRTLAVAETAFGSSVAQTLKTMEGSGQFFRLGVTVVTPETAQKLLSVPASLWQEGKGVNAGLAKALAEGARRLAGSDLGLGITGRASEAKGQDHLIHIALASAGKTECVEQQWPARMRYIENRMTKQALDQIKKHLLL